MRRALLVLMAFLPLPLAPELAEACGAIVSEDGAGEIDSVEVLLEHSDGEERLVFQVAYGAAPPGKPLGWMMPLPSAPQISETDLGPIAAAERISEPPEREHHVPELIPFAAEDTVDEAAGVAEGVVLDVIARQTVGGLRFVTLGGGDAAEVGRWLDAHGFAFHDRQAKTVQGYLDRGWVLLAARVPARQPGAAALAPIELRFPTENPVYPLALAGTDHPGVIRIQLFTVSEERLESTTTPEEVIPAEASTGAWVLGPGLQLIYASPLSEKEAASVGAQPGAWLGRYEGMLQTRNLREDLVFGASADRSKLDYDEVLESWRNERIGIYVQRVLYAALLLGLFVGLPVWLGRRGRGRASG